MNRQTGYGWVTVNTKRNSEDTEGVDLQCFTVFSTLREWAQDDGRCYFDLRPELAGENPIYGDMVATMPDGSIADAPVIPLDNTEEDGWPSFFVYYFENDWHLGRRSER